MIKQHNKQHNQPSINKRQIQVPDQLLNLADRLAQKINLLYRKIVAEIQVDLDQKYKQCCQAMDQKYEDLYSNSSMMSLGRPFYRLDQEQELHGRINKQKEQSFLSRHSEDSQSGVKLDRSRSTNHRNKSEQVKNKLKKSKSQQDEPDPEK